MRVRMRSSLRLFFKAFSGRHKIRSELPQRQPREEKRSPELALLSMLLKAERLPHFASCRTTLSSTHFTLCRLHYLHTGRLWCGHAGHLCKIRPRFGSSEGKSNGSARGVATPMMSSHWKAFIRRRHPKNVSNSFHHVVLCTPVKCPVPLLFFSPRLQFLFETQQHQFLFLTWSFWNGVIGAVWGCGLESGIKVRGDFIWGWEGR